MSRAFYMRNSGARSESVPGFNKAADPEAESAAARRLIRHVYKYKIRRCNPQRK